MAEGGGMWAFLPGERKFLGIKYADILIKTTVAVRAGERSERCALR